MARMAYNSVLDAGLLAMETAVEVGSMVVCSAEPADFAGVAAVTLATKATPVLTIADGDTGGRKCTISAATGVSITATGDATHIALCSADTLWFVTTCTQQTLTLGGTVDIPAWKITILDPTAPA